MHRNNNAEEAAEVSQQVGR